MSFCDALFHRWTTTTTKKQTVGNGAGWNCVIGSKKRDKRKKMWAVILTWVIPCEGLKGSSGDAELRKHWVRSVKMDTWLEKHAAETD